MKTMNVMEKLNTESGKSMAATAAGGFVGALAFFAAKEIEKATVKLGGMIKDKLQNRQKIEVNPAVVETKED